MADEPGRLECYMKLTKCIVLLFAGLSFVVVSYVLTGNSKMNAVIAGWVGLIFFGFSTILVIFRLFKREPVVIIDEVGIEDIRNGLGIIPWEEIGVILVIHMKLSKLISIETTDERSLLSIVPWYRKLWIWFNGLFLEGSPIYINPVGLSHSLDEILDFISDCGYMKEVAADDELFQEGVVLVNPLHTHEISE